MLEVKLLKVCHAGKEEARKLVPYITSTDVVYLEAAAASNRIAVDQERIWENVISSGCSRTKVRRLLLGMRPDFDDDAGEYMLAAWDYLYMNKLPIWHLERFSDEESISLNALRRESFEEYDLSRKVLASGDLDAFSRLLFDSMRLLVEAYEARDREIARNIDNAEKDLRGRYAALSRLPTIRLAAIIGASHRPERFTSIPVEVVDLAEDTKRTLGDNLDYLALSGKPLEELKPAILEFGRELFKKDNLIQP